MRQRAVRLAPLDGTEGAASVFVIRETDDTVNAVAEVIRRVGGPVSTALLDPTCRRFSVRGIEGLIGYKVRLGCAVGMGDPACPPKDTPALACAFRAFCRERRWHTVYAVAGASFASWAVRLGYAAVEFGEELILDPREDQQVGARGRELRKKVRKAEREGATVAEYQPWRFRDRALETQLEHAVKAWLGSRHGPQIYLAGVDLRFAVRGRRWFVAHHGGSVVGLLAMMELQSRQGYLLEHLLATPEAPIGTTELLVVEGLRALGAEGCGFATFGPAPNDHLGEVKGLSALSGKIAHAVYDGSRHVLHLDSKTRYRQKFQIARTEPSYLLFDPPHVGLRDVYGLLRAFNVSLWL
ncbi:MAG: DUF2156 domain-containing protein [Deltaproteobacteria bacterium]|nr:DUF2156 domain-containing protein [Deltaproteobacteria bacterium]